MILARGYGLPQDHFTIVPNAWLRDARLSRRARGLLVELMSHEPGWVTNTKRLAKNGPEGVAALTASLKELEACGYLVRERVRNTSGRLGEAQYTITDPASTETTSAEPKSENRAQVEPERDSPECDLPDVAKPDMANHTPKKNNYKKNNNQEEKEKKTPPPPPEESHQPREADETRRQRIAELETAIRDADLRARFDKLTADMVDAFDSLIAVHGIPALVFSAKSMHNPADPARYAQAWLPAWSALPTPRSSPKAPSWTSCGGCDTNGWLETANGVIRCQCHPRSVGGSR